MENLCVYIGFVLMWIIFGCVLCVVVKLFISFISFIRSKFSIELYEISYFIEPKRDADNVVKFKCTKEKMCGKIIYANSTGNALKKFYENFIEVEKIKLNDIKFNAIKVVSPIK